MPGDEHVLERRAKLLGERASHLRESLAESLRSASGRPLFTKQVSQREALGWWRKHRYDGLGAQALGGLTREQVMELDLWLASANEADMGEGEEDQDVPA